MPQRRASVGPGRSYCFSQEPLVLVGIVWNNLAGEQVNNCCVDGPAAVPYIWPKVLKSTLLVIGHRNRPRSRIRQAVPGSYVDHGRMVKFNCDVPVVLA